MRLSCEVHKTSTPLNVDPDPQWVETTKRKRVFFVLCRSKSLTHCIYIFIYLFIHRYIKGFALKKIISTVPLKEKEW